MTVPLVPRDPTIEQRTRRALDAIALILNGLLQSGAIAQKGQGAYVIACPTRLFSHVATVGNSTTSETDLCTDTLAAAQFYANNQIVTASYGGGLVAHATATRQLRVYFAGTLIFDSGAMATLLASQWVVNVSLIRVSATVVRYLVSLVSNWDSIATFAASGELTGLTLTATNILKITGTAAGTGAASSDITATMGYVEFHP